MTTLQQFNSVALIFEKGDVIKELCLAVYARNVTKLKQN